MHNRYTDFAELRPTGEASHIPDTRLDDCEGASRRQRVATSAGGYPDAPTVTNGECRSCGAPVPDGQTKCRFCLSNHLGSDATSTTEAAARTCLGIVQLVVESTTFSGAVAKVGAAANRRSPNETEPAVDDYALIYELDEAPARQLAKQWPSLTDAVQVSSAEGERLLSTARDRTGWHGQGASERQKHAPTRLYDQRGDGIRDASRFDAVLDDADDAMWLVPAMALTESTGAAGADRQASSVPMAHELDCQTCGRATDHRFKAHESVPDAAWTGQPTWEFRVCGSARYGPNLE
ncbi:biosurfactant protein 1 [Halolamina rubra]|uniref:biosurfactant protein 1 n=1 Tax=Halolamina rubra TaxID=1380430 RepID=UPI00067906CC|nr:hypothetical protein [Halolamina rubra]